ncbi:MAG TPA: hypothetical protein DCG51_04290 [Erysipelotrichaceae bacterium]|nr:hypothetical protein [Erysipelotrichaceae bacterium]
MIEVKRAETRKDAIERITSFEGSPHELIWDFITLRKSIENNQKLKILWSLAELMGDDFDINPETLRDQVNTTGEEDLKS